MFLDHLKCHDEFYRRRGCGVRVVVDQEPAPMPAALCLCHSRHLTVPVQEFVQLKQTRAPPTIINNEDHQPLTGLVTWPLSRYFPTSHSLCIHSNHVFCRAAKRRQFQTVCEHFPCQVIPATGPCASPKVCFVAVMLLVNIFLSALQMFTSNPSMSSQR